MWLSCGASAPASSTQTSGLKDRAFITNNVSSGSGAAGVFIVDAVTDVRPFISPISAGNTPGMMVVTPNRAQTLVFSGNGTQFSDNQLSIINNTTEAVVSNVALPGLTESFVVSPDSSTAYVAIPTATVVGNPPGIVEAISLGSGTLTGEVEVPSVRYLSIDNSGNRILAFSRNTDSVAVITPSNIGYPNAVTSVGGFDRPVWAFFTSDDSTAYVLNCGAECGGQQASIQQLNLADNTLGAKVPVCTADANPQCAGSVALVSGSTMYVAGTPVPPQPCPAGTAAQTCGLLTVVDLSTMTVTNSGILITDGYHNRIALGANGQLFIGARTCTEISTAAETRGCLSIYNTLPATTVGSVPPGGVLIPPANGDVTGIQPIAKRKVVYVVQNNVLNIYDATIDALEYNPNDPNNPGQILNLIGQFVDVKTVDF